MRSLLLAVLFLAACAPAHAQSSRWEAYASLNNVRAVAVADGGVWAGTDGGVFRYDLASGEVERYTPIDGLGGSDVRALAYDAPRRAVWVGYADGVLDRIDAETGAVASFVDIARATRFNARGINRIEPAGDSLRIVTEFGLVVFDAVRAEVRDTYERFGTLALGTPTRAVLDAPLPDGRPGLWVGTRDGVAWAPLDAPNLREPGAWTVEPGSPGEVLSLARFGGRVHAGLERSADGAGGVRRRNDDGSWTGLPYGEESVPDLVPAGERLYVVSTFWVAAHEGGDAQGPIYGAATGAPYSVFQSGALDAEGRLWIGDQFVGLVALPDLRGREAGAVEPAAVVAPQGPGSNTVLAVGATSGGLWLGHTTLQDRAPAFSRLEDGAWRSYTVSDGDLDARASIQKIVGDGEGNVWLGSEGAGVFRVTPEGVVERYTRGNSSLQSSGGSATYVEATGLAVDDGGNLWVTNRLASPPLHVRTPDGTWAGLRRPPGVPTSATYREIFLDSFGQKWIVARSTVTNAGAGLVVLDTRGTPLDDSDDRAAYVGSAGSVGVGLPSESVTAVAEDLNGRMWIGTERGLASVFSPGSIFAGNAVAQITWARIPDETDWFLRDLRILDIAVDPANRKWLASESGVWVVNGAGNEVVEHFTTANSPLTSDVVVDVEVDARDGTVYLATSGGLFSYRSGAVAPVREAGDLFVYPNPARADGGALPTISITGLVDDADVRVLTVDGQLVASFRTRGGSVQWDGRDQRTGDFVPSGVYLVAASGEGGTGYGKVAVIR